MKWVTAPMVLRMAGAVVPAAGQESPVSTTATGAGVGYEQALRDLHAGRDTVLRDGSRVPAGRRSVSTLTGPRGELFERPRAPDMMSA